MDLSIIIVSYNTKQQLEKCLESVLRSTDYGLQSTVDNRPKTVDSLNTEIIVVDNGSSDGSVEMIRESIKSIKGIKRIKLIENKDNLGFSRAVNQALRQAQGKVILLLNSDTIVKENSLNELLEFEKKVGPAIIGARLLNPDGTVQSSVFHLPTIAGAVKEYWFGKKNEFSKYYPTGNDPVEVESVVGGAMLISKKVIEKIGLLDEKYFMYFEDLDYCRRAKKAGFKVYYLPPAEIIHEHGASGKKMVDESNQWKRLIPSSKTYHGTLKHFLISFVLWIGQKFR